MNFDDIQYKIIRGAIQQQTVKLVQRQVELMFNAMYFEHNVKEQDYHFGDDSTPFAAGRYGSVITEGLLELLQPTMEQHTGKKLFPTYSLVRTYFNKSTLHNHLDRPSCQYSATLALRADRDPWPIWLTDTEGKNIKVALDPGDMLIYRGDLRPHWREEYQGKKHTQIFLHYVDANGPYASYKFDTRRLLATEGFSYEKVERRAKGIL